MVVNAILSGSFKWPANQGQREVYQNLHQPCFLHAFDNGRQIEMIAYGPRRDW
jgi:hypothetical protein